MIKSILLLSALLASTCEVGPFPKPPPQPEPPSPWDNWPPPDPAPAPEDDAATHTPCYQACKQLAKLGCPEAQPTTGGATCTQVCQNVEDSGVVSMNPSCVARAESCSIAKACGK
jgi:hypothetical protein